MRNALAAAVALALASLLVWWLASDPDGGPHAGPADDAPVAAGPAPSPVAGPDGGGTLARGPRPAPRDVPASAAIAATGSLRVVLVPPAGAVAPAYPRLLVEAVGPALVHTPLPSLEEDGSWLYDALPVGAYRLRASAEGFQALVLPAQVERDREARVQVALVPGGEIAYEAVLYSGEAPERMRLDLLDGRGVSQPYVLEVASGPLYVGAGKAVEVPAVSRVVGLKPGTYRLRATAPSGETDEETVTVAAGETARLRFEIRR